MPTDFHRLVTTVHFLTHDVHDMPYDFSLEGDSEPVKYQLPNALRKSSLEVWDFRPQAQAVWREYQEMGRVTPSMVDHLNGPASVVFEYEEIQVEPTLLGSVAVPVYGLLHHIELNESDIRDTGSILTHVGHGELITCGEAIKMTPNYVDPHHSIHGFVDPPAGAHAHFAITVIASRDAPAIIEQFACAGVPKKPSVLFIGDQIWSRQLSEGPIRTRMIQAFLEEGMVPGR